MKQLLISLLIPLLIIGCSSDDSFEFDSLTPVQKDTFLVGQWSTTNKETSETQEHLYNFKPDNSYEYYEIIDMQSKHIRKIKTGTFKNLDYGIEIDDNVTLLIFIDQNKIGLTSSMLLYYRDNKKYSLIE